MNSEVINLSDERESRAAKAWELARLEPPKTTAAAAHIAERCLSCAKVKAGLVEKHAPWDLKRTASLNLVAQMIEFESWRHLQQYAKIFHTLGAQQWRSDTLSIRMVSSCWVLTPQQESAPIARSLLGRMLTVSESGVTAAQLKELVRVAMCAPSSETDDDHAGHHEDEGPFEYDYASLDFARTHYRERFVKTIQQRGLDAARLKANAMDLLAKAAPTLPEEVSSDLVDFCLGGPKTELLKGHERWLWPQADPHDWALWGSEHLEAATRAQELQRMLDAKFGWWIRESDMRDLRRWQNTYLPGPKSRSKYGIYFRLIEKIEQDKLVPPDLAAEYGEWAREVKDELALQVHASKQPPVPHHLRHLADRVFIRLDALMDYLDTTEIDRANEAVAAILATASLNPPMPAVETVLAELRPKAKYWPDIVKTVTNIEPALKVLIHDCKQLVGAPSDLKKFCKRWKLDTPVIKVNCEYCGRGNHRTLTENRLPPFRPHCWCRDVRWMSSALNRAEDKDLDLYETEGRDMKYTRTYTKLMSWMLHRLLGLECSDDFPMLEAFYIARDLERRHALLQQSVL